MFDWKWWIKHNEPDISTEGWMLNLLRDLAEARKQGAEEERAAILRVIDGLEFADADDGDRATGYREGRNRCIAFIRARGAAEPVCTCNFYQAVHHIDCPCHKPLEYVGR